MRLLIIEDEDALRSQLVERLKSEGFAVDAAADGEEGVYYGNEYAFDAAIVDLGLPKLDGLSVIRQLRENGRDFPILVLTARGRWQDKVEGLEAGADDYMVKPFHIEELLARIKVLLRRSAGIASPIVHYGPMEFNSLAQEVKLHGELVDLTSYEYRVLEYLITHPGAVISKTELTEHIYDQDYDRDSNVIEVFVGRLRKKLDPKGELRPIETLRGKGYRFTIPKSKEKD